MVKLAVVPLGTGGVAQASTMHIASTVMIHGSEIATPLRSATLIAANQYMIAAPGLGCFSERLAITQQRLLYADLYPYDRL